MLLIIVIDQVLINYIYYKNVFILQMNLTVGETTVLHNVIQL